VLSLNLNGDGMPVIGGVPRGDASQWNLLDGGAAKRYAAP
jgi:hypothetical protein